MSSMPKADWILRNGRVWVSREAGTHEAVAVTDGRMLAVGHTADIDNLRGPKTRVIDLRGRCATPGINDAHMHLLLLGLSLHEVNVKAGEVPTLDGFLARIHERARALPPGSWVIGRGYDQGRLDVRRHPTRDDLDSVAPHHPVFVKRTCGHMAVVNSRAMEASGIGPETPDPPGGVIFREGGRPTGLLAETALDLVTKVIPPHSEGELIAAIDRGGRLCLSQGITSVMDAGVGLSQGWGDLLAYRQLREAKRLPLRVYLCLVGGPEGIAERAHAEGAVTGEGDVWLTVGPVKLFLDGGTGGKTAAMMDPYVGGGTGILRVTPEYLDEAIAQYHRMGYQLAPHAIGDLAIEVAVEALRKALEAHPSPNRRHRIEHCGCVTPSQLERMAHLGLIPVGQPVFLFDFGDVFKENLGAERIQSAYPTRRWMELGLRPADSSDSPVCDPRPMVSLYIMLTRRSERGTLLGPDQTVSLDAALEAMTANGAHASFSEGFKGTLLPDQAADIVVWSRDLFRASPEEILHDTRAELTLIDGRVGFDRLGEAI
jgi:predicted amidohydrolase YtcJ